VNYTDYDGTATADCCSGKSMRPVHSN
jgi:hypothetical protein